MKPIVSSSALYCRSAWSCSTISISTKSTPDRVFLVKPDIMHWKKTKDCQVYNSFIIDLLHVFHPKQNVMNIVVSILANGCIVGAPVLNKIIMIFSEKNCFLQTGTWEQLHQHEHRLYFMTSYYSNGSTHRCKALIMIIRHLSKVSPLLCHAVMVWYMNILSYLLMVSSESNQNALFQDKWVLK